MRPAATPIALVAALAGPSCSLDSSGGGSVAASIGEDATGSTSGWDTDPWAGSWPTASTTSPATTGDSSTGDGTGEPVSTSGPDPTETEGATDGSDEPFEVYLGEIVVPNTEGAKAIEVGFEPDLVMLWATDQSDPGLGNNAAFGRGWANGQRQAAVATAWRAGGNSVQARLIDDGCFTLVHHDGNLLAQASLSSLDANGFTLDWSRARPDLRVSFLALRGETMTTSIGTALLSGSETNVPVELGFEPTLLLTFGVEDGFDFGNIDWGGHGFAVSVAGSTSHGSAHRERGNGNGSSGVEPDVAVLGADDHPRPGLTMTASFEPTGFNLEWGSEVDAVALSYLAIAGISAQAGVLTQPTKPGAQSIPTAFRPRVILFDGGDKVGWQSEPEMVHGIATPDSQKAFWFGRDGTAVQMGNEGNRVILSQTAGADLDAQARVAFIGAAGFDLDWLSADDQARDVGWLVLGP